MSLSHSNSFRISKKAVMEEPSEEPEHVEIAVTPIKLEPRKKRIPKHKVDLLDGDIRYSFLFVFHLSLLPSV
jgi:hypothetical protein